MSSRRHAEGTVYKAVVTCRMRGGEQQVDQLHGTSAVAVDQAASDRAAAWHLANPERLFRSWDSDDQPRGRFGPPCPDVSKVAPETLNQPAAEDLWPREEKV